MTREKVANLENLFWHEQHFQYSFFSTKFVSRHISMNFSHAIRFSIRGRKSGRTIDSVTLTIDFGNLFPPRHMGDPRNFLPALVYLRN